MEPTARAARLLRSVTGLLGLVALVGTLVVNDSDPTFTAVNFFSYFTVESNVLAALVLLGLAAVPTAAAPTEGIRLAATVYMAVTGIVYNLLLRGIDVGTGGGGFAAVCNELLHVVLPVLVLLDWLLVPALRGIGRRRSMMVLVFPLVFLGYTLARGELIGWYPYPFLDPGRDGWPSVLGYSLAVAVLFAVLAFGLERLGNVRTRKVHGDHAAALRADDV